MSGLDVLQGKHILFVLAHCDDEIVCGWPVFQMPHVRKTVLIASSDRLNVSRQWCAHRKFVFYDICRRAGVRAECLDFNSDFYKTTQHGGELVRLQELLLNRIDALRPFDYLFTHNPHGEYGHSDHKFLFDLVMNYVAEPLLISDLRMKSDWAIDRPTSARAAQVFYRSELGVVRRDTQLYEQVASEYRRQGVWTWNQPPAERSGVFLLG